MFEQRKPPPTEVLTPTPAAEPSASVAEDYLERILRGDRQGAVRLIVAQVERGADAATLLEEVVEPTEAELAQRARGAHLTAEQARTGSVVRSLVRAMLDPPVFTDVPSA